MELQSALVVALCLAVGSSAARREPATVASSCVKPDGLLMSFVRAQPPATLSDMCATFSHVYKSATTACTASRYQQARCDTCADRSAAVGLTLDQPLADAGAGRELTVSVWAKPAVSAAYAYGEIFGAAEQLNIGFYPARGVSGCGVPANGALPGRWNHIVAVYRASGCSMWVNGVRHEGATTLPARLSPAIGCRGLGVAWYESAANEQGCSGDYHFSGARGQIGALDVWARALSDGEVGRLQAASNADTLSALVCRAEPNAAAPTPSPMDALLERVAKLEQHVSELSMLKVSQDAAGKCTVQCDNGKDGGKLELD